MPEISQRGITVQASPIRKLVPYAEEAKRKGRIVYHLNIGQPDIKTPQEALNAIRNLDKDIIEYSHSAGYESYRRKLASQYQKFGLQVDYNDILVTTGGSEAIQFAFLSCLDYGDEIIIPEPFYTNYNSFSQATGVIIKPITSYIEDGFALPPIQEFEKLITPKTKGIFICNPNNPTGYLYSKSELYQLRDIVKKHNLWLFSDEVYREFCYDGMEHFSAMKLEGISDQVVLFDSVSKRYSACGLRIGALVSKNQKLIQTALKYGQARLSPPGIGQIAAEAALDTPDSYFIEVYNEYVARRNFVIEALKQIPGVFAPMPGGAFYTIIRLPVDNAETFAQWLLEDFHYKNQTVMLAPAAGFYATPGLGLNEVRLAYVLKIEDLRNAVACLAEALKQYPNRSK